MPNQFLCLLACFCCIKTYAVSFVILTLDLGSSSLPLLISASPNLSKLVERQLFTSLSVIILFFMLNHLSHSTIKNFMSLIKFWDIKREENLCQKQ